MWEKFKEWLLGPRVIPNEVTLTVELTFVNGLTKCILVPFKIDGHKILTREAATREAETHQRNLLFWFSENNSGGATTPLFFLAPTIILIDRDICMLSAYVNTEL